MTAGAELRAACMLNMNTESTNNISDLGAGRSLLATAAHQIIRGMRKTRPVIPVAIVGCHSEISRAAPRTTNGQYTNFGPTGVIAAATSEQPATETQRVARVVQPGPRSSATPMPASRRRAGARIHIPCRLAHIYTMAMLRHGTRPPENVRLILSANHATKRNEASWGRSLRNGDKLIAVNAKTGAQTRELVTFDRLRAITSNRAPLSKTLRSTIPCQPNVDWASDKITSDNHAVGTQGRCSAVNDHGSLCGMPWVRISFPVRTCHQISGSPIGREAAIRNSPATNAANQVHASSRRLTPGCRLTGVLARSMSFIEFPEPSEGPDDRVRPLRRSKPATGCSCSKPGRRNSRRSTT